MPPTEAYIRWLGRWTSLRNAERGWEFFAIGMRSDGYAFLESGDDVFESLSSLDKHLSSPKTSSFTFAAYPEGLNDSQIKLVMSGYDTRPIHRRWPEQGEFHATY